MYASDQEHVNGKGVKDNIEKKNSLSLISTNTTSTKNYNKYRKSFDNVILTNISLIGSTHKVIGDRCCQRTSIVSQC